MFVGTVKWYDTRRGYGFIITAEGEDVLAHFTAIEGAGFRKLMAGEHVAYEARRTPKGLQASFVRRLKLDGHPPTPPVDPPVDPPAAPPAPPQKP